MARLDRFEEDGTAFAQPQRAAERKRPEHQRADRLPAFLAASAGLPPSSNDNQSRAVDPGAVDPGPADELQCLRGVLPPQLLWAAEARSRELGLGADQVLIQWGAIDEAAYVRLLADFLDIRTENFSDAGRSDCPLRDPDVAAAARAGIVPLRRNGQLGWTIAPRGFAARQLTRFAFAYPALIGRVHLATTADLDQFLLQQAGPVLADIAAEGLRKRHPLLSALPQTKAGTPRRHLRWIAPAIGMAAAAMWWPLVAVHIGSGLLATLFLAFAMLRIAGSLTPRPDHRPLRRMPDDELPVYSIIAALYREATSVAPLLRAIDALDYPHEKLDVILVLEPDDLQTRAAVARLGRMPHVRVLIAPAVGPKTKPKALNVALPFARGSFLAVFDAEDDPEPGQLRAALDAFRNSGADVACAQAGLCIDNVTESLLSRMFAAEYAGQFEVLLPGLVALGMPLPLGGSSNHFRVPVLREVGGWDAYNVTEDADLGFRLARFGYRSVTISSATAEEAPIRFGAWLRQRSRWMKGWMQTWSVHMRQPLRLWCEAGPRGFFAINIIVGGNVVTALAFPALLANVMFCLSTFNDAPFLGGMLAPLHVAAIMAGLLSTIVLGLTGLARQKRLRGGWILLLTPIYWGCLSIATWRALWQFWRNRYHWEKTEHGVSSRPRMRESRSGTR